MWGHQSAEANVGTVKGLLGAAAQVQEQHRTTGRELQHIVQFMGRQTTLLRLSAPHTAAETRTRTHGVPSLSKLDHMPMQLQKGYTEVGEGKHMYASGLHCRGKKM